jgi:cytochrome c-type biogenesis protein
MASLSIGLAFLAGLVSFLSPCVLPLVPGIVSYLAGISVKETEDKQRTVFLHTLVFVLGFSTFFSLLGILLNTIFLAVAYYAMTWLSRIGGLIIIFFGLFLTGIIRIPWLEKDYKLTPRINYQWHYLGSFVFGIAFAMGWTPCVGPILGGIIALAATQPAQAFTLLFSYALGLGGPFLLVGIFTAQAADWIKKRGELLKHLNLIFGIIMVIMGGLIFMQRLSFITNLFRI